MPIDLDRNIWRSNLDLRSYAFAVLLYVVFVPFARLFPVRIYWIKHPERIGEIAFTASLAWVEYQRRRRSLSLYCIQRGYPAANSFYDQMLRRNFPVYDFLWPMVQWIEDRISLGMKRPSWLVPLHSVYKSRDRQGLLAQGVRPFAFLDSEESAAKEWLKSLGWKDGEPFVCLLVRDSAYLDVYSSTNSSKQRVVNAYRDGDILDYVQAAEWLAGQGIWVFRMGKLAQQRIPSNHPRIIDYAFSDARSDFLDIWLSSKCNLFISTGTGIDRIPDIYRRPLLFVNYLPVSRFISWSKALTAPKLLKWERNGELLSLNDYISADYLHSDDYSGRGILVESLGSSAILEIVIEAWSHFCGHSCVDPLFAGLNSAVWKACSSRPDFCELHGFRHPEARFSSKWLSIMLEGGSFELKSQL